MQRYNIATHPKLATITCKRRPLRMTRHASLRSLEKNILVPPSLEITAGEVVELEIVQGQATKLVVRRAVSNTKHLVLVLVPGQDETWTVVTCWLNAAGDNHATLNKSRLSA